MAWLLQYRVVGVDAAPNSGSVSLRSQMHSFAACVVATYSALAVERVISSCLREAQDTAPLSIRKAKPEMAWWCSCDVPLASVLWFRSTDSRVNLHCITITT